MAGILNWIDTKLFGIRALFAAAVEQPERPALNFPPPFVVTDDSANNWTTIGMPSAVVVGERVLVAGTQSTDQTAGWTVIGTDRLDPADFNTRAASWSAILSTTNAGAASQVRLYNRTTNTVVASLSSTSLTSDYQATAVTLAVGPNLYEVQIKLGAIGAPERAFCQSSKLKITWN